jgi:hypothetical protein
MVSKNERLPTRESLIAHYSDTIQGLEGRMRNSPERQRGGIIRSTTGSLVEELARQTITLAWREIEGTNSRLSFGDKKRYQVPINPNYLKRLPASLKKRITAQKRPFTYPAQVDVHVFVDNELVMGGECKAYAENAMLKRILVDFRLLKSLHPNLVCCLFQLESMLGGEHSGPLKEGTVLGSSSTHTLMSFFPEVELNILTLLEGERRVKEPIHDPEFYKELKSDRLNHSISNLQRLLRPYK